MYKKLLQRYFQAVKERDTARLTKLNSKNEQLLGILRCGNLEDFHLNSYIVFILSLINKNKIISQRLLSHS